MHLYEESLSMVYVISLSSISDLEEISDCDMLALRALVNSLLAVVKDWVKNLPIKSFLISIKLFCSITWHCLADLFMFKYSGIIVMREKKRIFHVLVRDRVHHWFFRRVDEWSVWSTHVSHVSIEVNVVKIILRMLVFWVLLWVVISRWYLEFLSGQCISTERMNSL